MAQYPNSSNLDWTDSTVSGQGDDLVDQQDVNLAVHMNEMRAEVKAIAKELGANPRGGVATVAARLAALESSKSAQGHAHEQFIGLDAITAKGQLLAGTGAGAVNAFNPGSNGQVLMFDADQPEGMKAKSLDHGTDIGGLADDDHPHYHNNARHDARDHSAVAGVPPYPFVGMVVHAALPHTASVPAKWLECLGGEVSRTTYASLFTAIGTTYGAGNGSTTFNLPDTRVRFIIGRDPARTSYDASGETGGTETNTLTTTHLPLHAHGVGSLDMNTVSHDHGGTSNKNITGKTVTTSGTYGYLSGAGTLARTLAVSGWDGVPDHSHSIPDHSHKHTITGTTANAGSGNSFSNMPPFIVMRTFIYAGV